MLWTIVFVLINEEHLFLVFIITNIFLSFVFLHTLYLQDLNWWTKRVVEISTSYCINMLSTCHIWIGGRLVVTTFLPVKFTSSTKSCLSLKRSNKLSGSRTWTTCIRFATSSNQPFGS